MTGPMFSDGGRRVVAAVLVIAALGFLAGFAVLFWTRPPSISPSAADAAPAALVYPANPRYLTDVRGEPRFLLGVYRFFSAERAEWQAVLDRAQAEGWNTVRTLGICDGHISDAPEPDLSPWPLRRNGGGTILADGGPRFNLNELDDRFWNSYRDFLVAAERRNLTVVSELFGISGPFPNRNDRRCSADPLDCFRHNLWHRSNSVGGPTNHRNDWRTQTDARRDFFHPRGSLRAVQERLLERYLSLTARHGNVVYQPANEFFGRPGPDELDTRTAEGWLFAIRDKIRDRHPDATVLLNLRDLERFPDYGIRAPGFDGVTLHAPHEGNAGGPPYSIEQMIVDARILYPVGRFFAFDEDVGRPNTCDDYQDVQRQAAWTALTVGAGGYVILEDIFLSLPWCNRCDNPCPRLDPGRDLRHLAAFLAARPLRPWELAPDSTLVLSGTATALGDPEKGVVLYLRSGPMVELDLSRYASAWTGEWYDPRRGEFVPAGAVESGRPRVVFVPPGSGDWVLSLTPGGVD